MSARARLARLAHPTVVVGAIVLLGAFVAWRHTRYVHEWLIMTDELQYLKLAESLSDGAFPLPTLRGVTPALLSVLYPALIAPLLAPFSTPEGLQIVRVVNALLFASTAIPAYVLARTVLATRWPAYLAALLCVAVPWAATSAVVMTEAVAYPAFAWALLAIQRAVIAPSAGRDLVAILAIAVAFFARTQFVYLAAVFPAVVVAYAILAGFVVEPPSAPRSRRRRIADELRPHAALGALVAIALVLAVLPADPLRNVLGPYQSTAFAGSAIPDGLLVAVRFHLTYVAVGVGVLPLVLAAGWSVASLFRPVDRASLAFAILTLGAGGGLLYVVATFGLNHAGGPLDRYAFYVVPLLVVGAVACLAQGRPRPFALAAAAVFAFVLLRTSGVDLRAPETLYPNSPASEFHRVIEGRSQQFGAAFGVEGLTPVTLVSWGMLVAVGAIVVLLRRWPRYALAVVGVPLLALALAQESYSAKKLARAIDQGQGQINAVAQEERDWIDEALRGHADGDVALAPSPIADSFTSNRVWWNVEFWNKRVNRALVLAGFGDHTPFPQQQMTVDRRSGALTTSDGAQPRYIVFARNQIVFRPHGRALARYRTVIPLDPGLELFAVEPPYAAGWTTDGMSGDGWITREMPGRVRVFPRRDGARQRLTIGVDVPISGVPPARFEVRTGSQVVRTTAAPGTINGDAVVELCLPPGGVRDVMISTRANNRLARDRTVGVHVARVALTRGC